MAAKKERPAPAKAPRTRKVKSENEAGMQDQAAPEERSIPKSGIGSGTGAHARADISQEELRKLVSEAAYYRAKQRGFTPGHEVEDWVQAEAEVLRRIGADGTPRR